MIIEFLQFVFNLNKLFDRISLMAKRSKDSPISTSFYLFRGMIENEAILIDHRSLSRYFKKVFKISPLYIKYSIVFITHPGIIYKTILLRKKFKLTPQKYPLNSNYNIKKKLTYKENILKLRNALSKDIENIKDLYSEIDKFLESLGFDPNYWRYSFASWVLYNVFPVPPETGSIKFLDEEYLNRMQKYVGYKPILTKEIYSKLLIKPYPVLLINKKISKQALKDFIDDRWTEFIEPALEKLPTSHIENVDFDKFVVGSWVYRRRWLFEESWDVIEKKLYDFAKFIDEIPSKNTEIMKATDPNYYRSLERIELNKYIQEIKDYFTYFMTIPNSE